MRVGCGVVGEARRGAAEARRGGEAKRGAAEARCGGGGGDGGDGGDGGGGGDIRRVRPGDVGREVLQAGENIIGGGPESSATTMTEDAAFRIQIHWRWRFWWQERRRWQRGAEMALLAREQYASVHSGHVWLRGSGP